MKKSIIFSLVLLFAHSMIARDIKVPGDYKKIQAAINASSDGDRILVAAGNYSEFLNIEKSIKIIGTSPCTLYANTSPIKSARNKKALINIADNEVSIHNINLVGTWLDNGKLSKPHSNSSYCTAAIDSKDAFLDVKDLSINGITGSYFIVNGGVLDVINVDLSPNGTKHPAPSLAFRLDDVGGLTIKGVNCTNSSVKNFLAINEVFKGSRESFILISETEIGNSQLERGRKESYTISASVNQKEVQMALNDVVSIPDPAFKKLLVANYSINTNGDDEIQSSEAAVFDHYIICTNSNINDLTGIEAFPNIERLDCEHNNLTSLDLSKNIKLKELKCSYNELTSLIVNKNAALSKLHCNENALTKIDVSNNLQLKEFMCIDNDLTSVDVSQNKLLNTFRCGVNKISSLNLSNNTNLSSLNCCKNIIKQLDLTKNSKLGFLACYDNNLSSLELSEHTWLRIIECQNNNITRLNLKNLPKLEELYCGGNKIKQLDLSSNSKFQTLDINKSPVLESVNLLNVSNQLWRLLAKETPKLSCILVDDVNKTKSKMGKSVEKLSAIKNTCEGLFSEENEVEEIPGSLVPPPPSKKSVTTGITYDAKSASFNSVLAGKDYNFTLPQKLKYKSHNSSIKELVVAYSHNESGDNYVGIWNDKLEYLGEYNFKKIEVKAYTPITSSNNQNIVLVHYYDPTYRSEFVGIFNNSMQYLGQYEFTGKKDIKIQSTSGNPSVVFLDGSKKKRVEFDVTGNQISMQNL